MEHSNYYGALQKAIGSGFNASSTAQEVIRGIDLQGKTAIVTGGNTGIGLQTVKTLCQAGAQVVVPARDIKKAARNLVGIPNVTIEEMDLMNPHSIDAFAEKFLLTGKPLHLLINNAGIMWVPLRRDRRGYESQLATNYLAVFQLTARLWEALKKAEGARVVNVSSSGHQFSDFDFLDPNFLNREYETLKAYGQSKTAVNLFSIELDKRAEHHNVRVYALCPGAVGETELAREAPADLFHKLGFSDAQGNILQEVASSLKTIQQGAATTVWAATSKLLDNIGGVYCENADIADLSSDTSIIGGIKPYSLDKANAEKLWTLSEEMTGLTFNIS
ncbi:SDR family NAD(P)-dependent oxidoreductase [Flavobacterium sp. TR2]|uniref:SDR family NAD(P)-dependent oxidoreductase n=1 Tax=Flavobacterium sp. TR2 TaxID=2977321 RepID=UPI0021B1316C|nr:SDR family NAD(P)-dependent oxidoreductase [Flavobacterium sp. TR2]UWY27433.1 SDR family NAD(P)-dependent oxidoreductase [Flavobacterium sp. TR2]